mgnify:CR=1 FL=1
MPAPQPSDADLDQFLVRIRGVTERWARKHALWQDCSLKDPLDHYNDEPRAGDGFLLLCGDGPAVRAIVDWDDAESELRNTLAKAGVYTENEDAVTVTYQFTDPDDPRSAAFERRSRWRWMCRLLQADTHDVSGDLYQHFVDHPQDMQRLPSRDFERLVASIFAARGWRAELGPGTGDGGVDVRLWQADPLGEILTLVQVKRYAVDRPISLEAVAALEGHVERQRASRGLFVTSSRFLPGVRQFANLNRHRLALADANDVARWCEDNAAQARIAKARAFTPTMLSDFAKGLGDVRPHHGIVIGGHSRPHFALVLKEAAHSALLVHVPARLTSGDWQRGMVAPVLDGRTESPFRGDPVFRARRTTNAQGISYWGQRQLFRPWDGVPALHEIWD